MGPILVRGQAPLRQQLSLSPRLEQLHFLASILNAGRKEENARSLICLAKSLFVANQWRFRLVLRPFYLSRWWWKQWCKWAYLSLGRNYGPTRHSKTQLGVCCFTGFHLDWLAHFWPCCLWSTSQGLFWSLASDVWPKIISKSTPHNSTKKSLFELIYNDPYSSVSGLDVTGEIRPGERRGAVRMSSVVASSNEYIRRSSSSW